MSMMDASHRSLVNHIFLPPQLPHSLDDPPFAVLLRNTSEALAAFKLVRPDTTLTQLGQMLKNTQDVHSNGQVNEEKFAELLGALPWKGGSVVLHISAQNAGIIVSNTMSAIRFEVFELSPLNEHVYKATGRLRRSFPGSAVDVDFAVFKESGFAAATAHTLAKMSHQAAPGMQPQIRKAGELVDEDRDTADPAMVSEVFMGFLRSVGRSVLVTAISKNTREEVMWNDARSPWRRSPVWLMLRVSLQLKLPHDLYKEFVTFMMSQLLKAPASQGLSSDLRYAMMAKIARRMLKLSPAMNAQVVQYVQTILQDTTAALDKQRRRLQARKPLDLLQLRSLNFEQDELTAIPALDEYLRSIAARQSSQQSTDFQPVSGLIAFRPQVLPDLSRFCHDDYANQNLLAFETWVTSHLRNWSTAHKSDADACKVLGKLMKSYHSLAYRQYTGNPEATSVCHLTILQLWVALDTCALHLCPLLGDYDTGLSLDWTHNLLLPSRDQMERLSELEAYFRCRYAKITHPSCEILHEISSGCFGASYFDQSVELKSLLATIQTPGAQEKAAKVRELAGLKTQYDRLRELGAELHCTFVEVVVDSENDIREDRHSPHCLKCNYADRAAKLRIAVHEWPLPSTLPHQKVVVFELQPPSCFVHWRDNLVFLLTKVLEAVYRTEERARAENPLSKDQQLSRYAKTSLRIGLLSQNKPHLRTHRKFVQVATATPRDVCLASGLDYKYYDNDANVFSDDFNFTEKVPLACTYTLPSRSAALQKYIYRQARSAGDTTPNNVIASLSECPDHMSLDEYKKLSIVPYGFNLQWSNLLVQLGFPAINLKKVESTLVLLQCIYQTGPAGEDFRRVGHRFCGNDESATKLLEELRIALPRIKQNWESSQALSIFISIASRLLSLSASEAVQQACVAYLEDARTTALEWIHDLQGKAQQVTAHDERVEYLIKRAEVALICVDSFNVDDAPLATTIGTFTEQASTLVQCMIIMQEGRQFLSAPSTGPTVRLLLLRAQRLLYRCHSTLASNRPALDDGISKSWSGFRPGSQWAKAGSDHWLTTLTKTEVSGVTLRVHFNILDGELLVNGLPLSRLPRHYADHASYRTLFGYSAIEVMPSAVPGMDYAAKRAFSGHEVHFGTGTRPALATKDLLVQASQHGKRLELLPPDLFENIFPAAFVKEHVHWYGLDDGVVYFRPSEDLWNGSCPRTWNLVLEPQSMRWRLIKDAGSQILMGLASDSSKALSLILSPFAEAVSIHVISLSSSTRTSGVGVPALRELEVEIPGLQLGFNLQAAQSKLRSKQFPKMIVDRDQSVGTLLGLENKLLLCQKHGPLVLLILDGPITYRHSMKSNHVSVTIQKAAPCSAGGFHTFRVDQCLRRLIGNGSLQSKLFLAYLHSLTSYCLPDSLTSRTGTEQALSILRSAEVRSFDRLTEENVRLLNQMMALTPVRRHYPLNERVMQTISWSPGLGFLAQHGGFRIEVESIFDQAQKSSIFYPELKPLKFELRESDADLMRRSSIRHAMVNISGFGAEDFTTAYDVQYPARDQRQNSSRCSSAFTMSAYVYHQKQDLNWSMPSDVASNLWNAIALTKIMPGPRDLRHPQVEYDASLMGASSAASIYQSWMGLNQGLCAVTNKFSLMMWLSTLACSTVNALDTNVLQILAISHTRVNMPAVNLPPACDSFRLGLGKCASEAELRTAVAALRVPLTSSPDATLIRRQNEKTGEYTRRRQQVYESNSAPIINHIAWALSVQWPCQIPVRPNVSGLHNASAYINLDRVMIMAKPKFKAWFDNLQFYRYLERIGHIVTILPVNKISVPSVPSLHPSRTPPSVTHIKQQDLFSGEGPSIPDDTTGAIGLEWLDLRDGDTGSNVRLQALIDGLDTSAAGSKYEKAYVASLRDSALKLQMSIIEGGLAKRDGLQRDLDNHLDTCRKQVELVFKMLSSAVSPVSSPQLDCANALWTVQHWPRVSPTLFLQQLSRSRWPLLRQSWRDAIVRYGLALTALQRAERLVDVLRAGSETDLTNEIRNTGHVNWNPHDFPDSLLLEAESGIMIREVQEEIAGQMRDPQDARNSVLQLNMGEGKSSLIVPIVAATLANGSQLVRVLVAKPQAKQMAQMIISKLGGLLDRRVFFLPFSRAIKTFNPNDIKAMLDDCMATGGVLLVQPEHILSFQLMASEKSILGNGGLPLLRIQDFFDGTSRDIVDESDENFSVKFELVYTMGTQRPVDMSPERWLRVHEVLELVRKYSQAASHTGILPGSLELTHCLPGRFPRTRTLTTDAQDRLFGALHICNNGLSGFPIARQTQAVRNAVLTYITKLELTPQEIQSVEGTDDRPGVFWSESSKSPLLLLRGLFAAGVLAFAFGQKRWRVNYGLDSSRKPNTKLAVPYRAKDMPSPRSEFSHPDVIITLTTLSYYYAGLEEEDLATAFDNLARSDQADTAYQTWVRDAHDMPAAFAQLDGINLKDRHQFATELLPRLRFGKASIDYFLANIVFPKEMKEFPHKLSASGWDIGKKKALPTTGFSGTNDSRTALPLHVHQLDLPNQRHTNALVLDYLLRDGNDVQIIAAPALSRANVSTSDAERLLDMVVQLEPPARVVLDVGAQILELSNVEVAKRWLVLSDASVQAVVFFNQVDELSVINRNGRVENLQTSAFATQLDVCLVFLDESHTRGTDLRLPETYRAAVTLGAGLTKDRLTQACMRMRNLGKGQTVVFCVPAEIHAKILLCTSKATSFRIEICDILHWTIASETWTDMRRSMPLWAAQGVRFDRQDRLWRQAQNQGRTILSPQQAAAFLEDEAQSLEDRHRPSTDFTTSLFAWAEGDVEHIEQRCQEFESLSFNSTTLQEEQERELSPEIESERQVQRPASAQARSHQVHPDLVHFVATGVLRAGSQAWQPAFATLSDTTAGSMIDLAQMGEGGKHDLLVTMDFARTVKSSGPSSNADSYQRPVQRILTAVCDGAVTSMLVVSPFEADKLYPRIHASKKVALHLYNPRCNSGFRSLDRLDFFTTPHQTPATLHPRLIAQLNLFSGQLYINDHEDFKYICAYLGIATETAPEGWEVAADGFILRDDQGRVGGAASRLTKSPVKFLQTLMAMRRDGEGFSKTHMGALLEGRLLQAEDFEE
ncbi:hypothetical protein LTR35_013849 [Friedmanniomyces endolithicus]|nr:hypothetical protein LTR35_013849 [Friedmanniomyces endolithicus]KAK0275884.1 hypothetical protein LTS00_014812 [Friedmanniomyces endolithicus]KAK0987890.1 hypothetical protein LTR54_013030 [Friedmanniomyces endolithicus]